MIKTILNILGILIITSMIHAQADSGAYDMVQLRNDTCLGVKLREQEGAYRGQTEGKFKYINLSLPWGVKILVNSYYEDCYDPADGSGELICSTSKERGEMKAIAPYIWEGIIKVHEGYGNHFSSGYSYFELETHLPDGHVQLEKSIPVSNEFGGPPEPPSVPLALKRKIESKEWRTVLFVPDEYREVLERLGRCRF